MAGVNEPGQHHAYVYSRPEGELTYLRGLDGAPTGGLWTPALQYLDGVHDGRVRLDYHEILLARGEDGRQRRMVFAQGGNGFVNGLNVHSGHVYLGDLRDSIGSPTPSGGGRGASVDTYATLYRLAVCSMPPYALYKPGHEGSTYQTYAWPQARGGDLDATKYAYVCWSWINVAGGGMIRGVVQDGRPLRACRVPSIEWPMWTFEGVQFGVVTARYVRVAGVHGWLLWRHRVGSDNWVYHVRKG